MMAPTDDLVLQILQHHPEWFGSVLDRVDEYEVQILYTQIDRDVDNAPQFSSHAFRVDPTAYFYPASTVKMSAAFQALEKLRHLAIDGLDADTPLRIDAAAPGQIAALHDATAPGGVASIGHYIRKIFLVSDNDAHNNLRLTHRLALPRSPQDNACTNPMTFFEREPGHVLHEQPLVCSSASLLQRMMSICSFEPCSSGRARVGSASMIRRTTGMVS